MPGSQRFFRSDQSAAEARLEAMREVGRRAEELIEIARELDRIAEAVADEGVRREIRAALRRLLGGTEGIMRASRAAMLTDAPR